ncbi:Putative L-aspartate dehydrogenase [Geodia barretti]|uniref:Aspartate dehydrogenase domain-containing protein n=1 Tax=Geodia barretti TaxID=519541 RepID=A0AA35RR24_GEOBA|nr:Putative L-aspartate dehydrogenase [Geodia barretti]
MSTTGKKKRRRVGIVGFGRLGRYLYNALGTDLAGDHEVAFVWNRSEDKMLDAVPQHLVLRDLGEVGSMSPDLIVEVAHPSVVAEFGQLLLQTADFMVGSPTALAEAAVERNLLREARDGAHGLYVPAGAFWGGQDIQKMADRGTLRGLKVTMKKHPSAFKLTGRLAELVKTVGDDPLTLYDGPVRGLCPLAPNNVNTMACAAIAAHNLGFDGVIGCLVADPSLASHVVEVDVYGPGSAGTGSDDKNCFTVKTVRSNPAASGVVTGHQTYSSFLSSLLCSKGGGPGVHLC